MLDIMLDFIQFCLFLILIFALPVLGAWWSMKTFTPMFKKFDRGKGDPKILLVMLFPLSIAFGLFSIALWAGHKLFFKSKSVDDPDKK